MDISISVLGLTGIMMQDKSRKKKSKKAKRSTIGETSRSYSSEDDDAFPVKAVASFFKQVNSNHTAIASHLPSMTIRPIPPDEIDDGLVRYNATWPTDFDPLGNELSTFKCSRMMQIEDEGQYNQQKQYRPSHTPMMIPERLQLTIGLTRGSEMLSIGTASVVVTGDEAQDVQVNLPISLEKKEKDDGNATKKAKKKAAKSIKPITFVNDPQKKYHLHSNACLKLLLRATPVEPSMKNNAVPNPAASNKILSDILVSSGSNDGGIDHMMSNESDDSMSQYPPTFEPQPQHYGEEDKENYRYPDYLSDNDEYTEDGTTDGTVTTSDTHSTLSRFTNAFTCAGIMCVPVAQTSSRIKKSKASRSSLPGVLNTFRRLNCESSNQLSSVDDVTVSSYGEYKKAMSKHTSDYRQSSRGRSHEPKSSPYTNRSNDDCSVATEKVKNLAWSNHNNNSYSDGMYYADRMI